MHASQRSVSVHLYNVIWLLLYVDYSISKHKSHLSSTRVIQKTFLLSLCSNRSIEIEQEINLQTNVVFGIRLSDITILLSRVSVLTSFQITEMLQCN